MTVHFQGDGTIYGTTRHARPFIGCCSSSVIHLHTYPKCLQKVGEATADDLPQGIHHPPRLSASRGPTACTASSVVHPHVGHGGPGPEWVCLFV